MTSIESLEYYVYNETMNESEIYMYIVFGNTKLEEQQMTDHLRVPKIDFSHS